MRQETFYAYINGQESLQNDDQLIQIVAQYPFFLPALYLLLRNYKIQKHVSYPELLRKAGAFAPNRALLADFINEQSPLIETNSSVRSIAFQSFNQATTLEVVNHITPTMLEDESHSKSREIEKGANTELLNQQQPAESTLGSNSIEQAYNTLKDAEEQTAPQSTLDELKQETSNKNEKDAISDMHEAHNTIFDLAANEAPFENHGSSRNALTIAQFEMENQAVDATETNAEMLHENAQQEPITDEEATASATASPDEAFEVEQILIPEVDDTTAFEKENQAVDATETNAEMLHENALQKPIADEEATASATASPDEAFEVEQILIPEVDDTTAFELKNQAAAVTETNAEMLHENELQEPITDEEATASATASPDEAFEVEQILIPEVDDTTAFEMENQAADVTETNAEMLHENAKQEPITDEEATASATASPDEAFEVEQILIPEVDNVHAKRAPLTPKLDSKADLNPKTRLDWFSHYTKPLAYSRIGLSQAGFDALYSKHLEMGYVLEDVQNLEEDLGVIINKVASHNDKFESQFFEPEPTVSETLASIYVQQGKISEAVLVYEKLILKFPDKMQYFASQIEALK